MDKLLAYIREEFERDLIDTKLIDPSKKEHETIMIIFDKASLKAMYKYARERAIPLD